MELPDHALQYGVPRTLETSLGSFAQRYETNSHDGPALISLPTFFSFPLTDRYDRP